MSTRKEVYIIHGFKFDENFTCEFWEKDFYNEMVWDKNKPIDQPFFITDGMNGDYTFFGFVKQISNGWDDEDYDIVEIHKPYNEDEIISKFKNLYPEVTIPSIKTYYLPHWV